jgi:hypothetical protein
VHFTTAFTLPPIHMHSDDNNTARVTIIHATQTSQFQAHTRITHSKSIKKPICKHRDRRYRVYCILTAEPRDLSISRQSTSPQYLLNSYARTLAARGSTRTIAASPSKQNRLVESNVAVAVVGAAPTQLLHRPCQRLLHTHTYTHAREFHGILRTVQPLQILTHTLLLARQLYDFQLPVILPLDSHVG